MKYTKDNLHGIEYLHKDGRTAARIIKLNEPIKGFNHTTCDIKTGRSDTPWFTDENAIKWLEDGVWIPQRTPQSVIDNYPIF